ncbi:uncharacterized protein LOC127866974 [Dreissena polymorpha]|uniref:Uncharacterized protein n=1 Tax=Dreissena polymorpha TaxID=45954 RepID=A0A9D4LVQ8_DREPO|nr:uncharacterized protein LOC127866974 [Dreissena polymorpha]XP_052263822.1 uncharacterized protein LOC127866974 [Dreissena polymorpha]KAH3864906.1 hypothetical protein DPMN_027939 [Dreissena polymorpha]
MSVNNTTFRFLAILSVLTVLNVTFLGFNHTRKENVPTCSVDDVLGGITDYIRGTGARDIESVMPEVCKAVIRKTDVKQNLIASVNGLISVCLQRNTSKTLHRTLPNPIVTLFTTWSETNSTEKKTVHNLTMRNWAQFKPMVEVVVFTNSTEDAKLAKAYGASVLPVLQHRGGGSPVLKWMFQEIMKDRITSTLFGYVNSDILFTDKFVQTLQAIIRNKKLTRPFMIIGRRTNVLDVTLEESETFSDLEKIAKTRGELFGANAEDFFITNSAFPWAKIIDVVVGRLAFDNWIVGHAICELKIDVVDVSDTVLAVHQSTKAGGNYEGFQNKYAHYNAALFKALALNPVYERGFTICTQERTFVSFCGEIMVTKRRDFWGPCDCHMIVKQ